MSVLVVLINHIVDLKRQNRVTKLLLLQ